ncbi:MAG: hemin ABC transporter substrate-binding protein [Acidimicrobiia bacterium]
MKTKISLALALAAALTLAACGAEDTAESTTSVAEQEATTTPTTPTTTTTTTPTTTVAEGRVFVGADGVETTISDISRIVSLNGDLTEIIFELGLGENVVAVDVTTTYPADAAAMNDQGQTVGFAQQLAAEAVLRFDPTLVIGDQQVAPPEVIEQLRGAGVPVVILETQTTLDGVETKISQVAEILGVPAEGADLAERVMAEINAAQDLAESDDSDPTVAFVYVRGPQVVFLFGAGMATQAMIEGAGAIDAGVEAGVFGPAPLTPEALVAAAPAVIVLPEAGLAALGGIEAFLQLPGVAETPAAMNNAFLAYDEAYFFNLGPRAGQALDEFVRDLYPDIDG